MTTTRPAPVRTLASRVAAVPEGGLVELMQLGRSVGAVDLAAGVPSWPETPPELIEATIEVLRTGTNQYEDPAGNLAMRSALARSLTSPPDPVTELTITVGGSEALCDALLTTVDPGDEVVVVEPFYENFLSAIALAGGIPRFVRRRSSDWRWDPADLAAAFGPRTQAITLSSPCNPTGRVLDGQELAEVAELAERWDITVISDEVYAAYVFDDRTHLSMADVPGLRERSIVIGSLSKSHAVSGWRLGYLRAPADLTAALRRVHMATTVSTAGPFQQAVATADLLDRDRWDPRPGMQLRRDTAVEIFTKVGLRCPPPQGGCYVFADVSAVDDAGCSSYARRLLDEHGVLIAPGRLFFAGQTEPSRFVRIAFNKTLDVLAAAAQRLPQAESTGERHDVGSP